MGRLLLLAGLLTLALTPLRIRLQRGVAKRVLGAESADQLPRRTMVGRLYLLPAVLIALGALLVLVGGG